MNDLDSDPDRRYARGELSREEWLRQRGPGRSTPSSVAGSFGTARGLSSHRRILLVVVVALVVISVVTAGLVWSLVGSFLSVGNPTYGTPELLNPSDLSALNASATTGMSFSSNDTLWLPSGPIHLVIYASPPEDDLRFVVQGLLNPAIHAVAGSRITVTLVNMDGDMYHNWGLTRSAPPYVAMPMMSPGTMMSTAMLSPATASGFWAQEAAFTAVGGSYWYLCTYPGHASDGMFGSFVVD